MDDQLDDLANLASLGDPVRRSVYRFAIADRAGVDRVQVATGLDLGRSLAAYHLDRLVEEGLLVARFEHRGTRRGPGSGRPSKVYSRAPTEFDVTLPPRDYSLAADVLASAYEALDDHALDAVKAAAAAKGRLLRGARPDLDRLKQSEDVLNAAETRLAACGYEPYRSGACIRLRNCPFDALTSSHRELVCTMNHALIGGLLDAEDDDRLSLQLEPSADECCVTISARASA